MANPDENNNQNNSVKNKQKEGKEFVQENETHQQKGVNVEDNYKSQGVKPMSVNFGDNESRAVGNDTPKKSSNSLMDWVRAKKEERKNSSSMGGDLSTNPKRRKRNSNKKRGSGDISDNSRMDGSNLSLNTEPENQVAELPKVDAPAPELTDATKETTENDSTKQEVATSGDSGASGDSGDPKKEAAKEKKEKPKFAISDELKEIIGVIGEDSSKEDKVPTESADEEGSKKTGEAIADIAAENKLKDTPTNETDTSGTSTGGTETATTNAAGATTEAAAKEDPNAAALSAFSIEETEAEQEADAVVDRNKNEGKNRGLMVGRSIGYGAMILPTADGKLNITKFSESDDPIEEEAAKDKYNKANDQIAKNMEEYGEEEVPKDGGAGSPKEGYLDAYFQGYNEGHREGTALKAEAAAVERMAQMEKEQGTDEYLVGASLGMLCGVLTAKGETEVDTTFSMTKDGKFTTVDVKTTVADLDSAAFDKKQTPGGELSGEAYEKAFLLHYNMGYREGQNQRNQPPPMDDDYKLGHEQGYKLGTQKAKGGEGDKDLVELETTYDAKDEQTLEKDELQQYRGFYAGYNKGYRQVQDAKKNKAQTEREEKNNDPTFIAGYSTGNLKGFLMAMIEPSGIDLAEALKSTAKMEAAGVPDYFPIPDELRESILATLKFGEDVAENENEKDPHKALLGKPLFKEGLLFGYNRGYKQGQNSRVAFKRDKHKMHPDYQRSVLVLVADDSAEYTGPAGDGTFVTGFAIGQILANAQFEFNQLTNKKNPSDEDKTRLTNLSKALTGLNGFIGKESSYYQSGVNEFYNWWMGILMKKAQDDKAKYGYSGEEGSDKKKGYDWGVQVGAEVVKGKEKIKEINRKGRDITPHRTKLNNAIKKSEDEAKKNPEATNKEEYYIGYRNGYNDAFRIAKKGKKSDKGNEGTGDLLERVAQGGIPEIDKIEEAIKDFVLGSQDMRGGISKVTEKFKPETAKAFKDGLSRGYSSGYSLHVFDPNTGATTTDVKDHRTQIKEEHDKYKNAKSGKDSMPYSGNMALGMLYYFLLGYQYHNERDAKVKYGAPKGKMDADSFNSGYEDAKTEVESENIKEKKSNKNKAESKHAYEEGYETARRKVQYDKFKGQMIQAANAGTEAASTEAASTEAADEQAGTNTKGNDTEEGGALKEENSDVSSTENINNAEQKVDSDLTGGLSLLDTSNKEETEALEHGGYYKSGFNDAEALWAKIIYMRKGVALEGVSVSKTVNIDLLGNGESLDKKVVEELKNDDKGSDMAIEYYAKKDFYINQIANAAVESIIDFEEMIKSFFSFAFGTEEDSESEAETSREEIKAKYIEGYKARIASIEAKYKEKFIDDWIYDYAYFCGIVEIAPDTEIETPMAPYTQMSTNEMDESNPNFKKGYLEGLKTGNLIKTGIIQPSEMDLAKASGEGYNKGFEEGNEEGHKDGLDAVKNPSDEIPEKEPLVEKLKAAYKAANNGVDNAMNGDYEDGYIKAYFSAYKETRSYEYGRLLGYKRGAKGGNDMFNLEPEENVHIDDEDAFYKGFDEGRDLGASGLPPEALYEKNKKNKRNKKSYGEDYSKLLKGATEQQMNGGENEEEDSEASSDEIRSTPLEILEDLLLGGSPDFYLDEILLLDMFYALERKIEEVQYYIQDDLEDIELNRSLADLASGNNDVAELAKLEQELKEETVNKKKPLLRKNINKLKLKIKKQETESKKVERNWQAAEAAAKKKIDGIRLLMKENLAFDTPLKSNEDILKYIKINLESSKGNDEDIYEDIDIFNELTLKGAFDYEESSSVEASVQGSANFYLDHYAENVHIENAEVLMATNGFEFKASGLSYIKSNNELNFMSGAIVTPTIEGGEHRGEQYKYNFESLNIYLGQGVKSQINAQKDKLQGGPA